LIIAAWRFQSHYPCLFGATRPTLIFPQNQYPKARGLSYHRGALIQAVNPHLLTLFNA
jgi:hypothetical protein